MPTPHPLPIWLLPIIVYALQPPAWAEGTGDFSYLRDGQNYPYSVKQTGENYTFEFEKTPGEGKKIPAAVHVLASVYGDDSINPSYSETFMKETALCFVFDGTWYSYRACFLPNDYSPGKRERFWGFVSQLPNAKWLITRNLLPVVLAFGLLFFVPWRRRQG
ncbi:MAG: hypothetical protein ACKN9T_13860 [Candidatus Methylumidiphilus sp.]